MYTDKHSIGKVWLETETQSQHGLIRNITTLGITCAQIQNYTIKGMTKNLS